MGTQAAEATRHEPTVEEKIRAATGAVKIGLRTRKGAGFWKDAGTVAVLRDFNAQKISEKDAMIKLGIGQDFMALRYYAKRLKTTGTTVRQPKVKA